MLRKPETNFSRITHVHKACDKRYLTNANITPDSKKNHIGWQINNNFGRSLQVGLQRSIPEHNKAYLSAKLGKYDVHCILNGRTLYLLFSPSEIDYFAIYCKYQVQYLCANFSFSLKF